jgi:D-alanine-D-alanine ligase
MGTGMLIQARMNAGEVHLQRRIRVGVIYGGRSGEHEVSIESAVSVLASIDRDRYEVLPIAITHEGAWHIVEPSALLADADAQRTALLPSADPQSPGLVAVNGASSPTREALDVAFPLVHGTYGEDGCVQGLLELAGVPYVGAGVLGSAVGMDKIVMKRVFAAAGLPLVSFVEVSRRQWERDPGSVEREIADQVGFPCFVKPANLGSSVGVSKATSPQDVGSALADAAQYSARIVVEAGVDARELECGVLGNDDPEVSVVGEVQLSRDFYDYEAKYHDDRTQLRIPAEIPTELSDRIRSLAILAFRSVGAAGMARVDFFFDRRTEALYLNEINTIPGFTPASAYPRLWEATGVPYRELIDRLIALALERHADTARNRTRYAE